MAKLKRAVIREEYVAITKNDSMALILNQLIYWSKRTRDYKKFIQEERKRATVEDKDNDTFFKYGWIYKSYSQLKHELMTSRSEKTIGRHLEQLVELGFISRKKNEKYKFDKKYKFRVNILNIINELNEHGYEMLDYKFEFQNVASKKPNVLPTGQNVPSTPTNDVAIAEIITEITTENINKTSGKIVNMDNLNLNGIINTFAKITTGSMKSKDMIVLNELLKYPSNIPPNQKIEIVTETIRRIGTRFKEKNPYGKINSFSYFKNAVINEFKHLEQGGEIKIESTGKKSKSTEEYNLEELYSN
jgi:hypothetical protein